MRVRITDLAAALANELRMTIRSLFGPRPYRPEKYYMRGPGPQWRAKHHRLARKRTLPAR